MDGYHDPGAGEPLATGAVQRGRQHLASEATALDAMVDRQMA
ncbi:MAG: hypothetical protein AVDCRST_MAG50-2770 [uncultured Acidimicrobiales bacterium]|uniref:Uncharacterized protein n=1 Tax=uncultured Acidimicrobiales bacterium TaxID=310071 RepID=A0A6J4IX99_9ACTN|nr:MAG: hypothetical protein AVDCRST_MAG50-2770 [uncultured Acidimicrobiales bacterium]